MNSMENAHLGLPRKVNVCKFFHKNLKKTRFAWSKTIVEFIRVSIAATLRSTNRSVVVNVSVTLYAVQIFTDFVYYFIFPSLLVSKTYTQGCQILKEHKVIYDENEQW